MELTPSALAPLPGPLCPLPLEGCATPSSLVAALPRAAPQPLYDLGIVSVPSGMWPYVPIADAADDDVVLTIDGIATRRRRLPPPAPGWEHTFHFATADGSALPAGVHQELPDVMEMYVSRCARTGELLVDLTDQHGIWLVRVTVIDDDASGSGLDAVTARGPRLSTSSVLRRKRSWVGTPDAMGAQ